MPAGITAKVKITVRFLERKQEEYLELQAEILAFQIKVERIEQGEYPVGKVHEKND